MEFSIKDFFIKCDQIRRKLWIWSHLLKTSFNGKLYFLCSVSYEYIFRIFLTKQGKYYFFKDSRNISGAMILILQILKKCPNFPCLV